jgi:hypothetical protein
MMVSWWPDALTQLDFEFLFEKLDSNFYPYLRVLIHSVPIYIIGRAIGIIGVGTPPNIK